MQDQVQVRDKWEGIRRRRYRKTRLGIPHSLRSQTQPRGDSAIFSLETTILPVALLPAPPQTASFPPCALWSHLSLRPSSSLQHHLPYQAFLVSSQHALAAPSLNLSLKLRHPPTPIPWSARQNIPQAFSLQGPPLPFCPVFPNCPSSPLPVSSVIFLLYRCWSDILKCISTLLYSCIKLCKELLYI